MIARAGNDVITLGVQGIVISADRRSVLLVRHSYRPGWHFPGGGVERGETLDCALKRELLEETGVVIIEPPKLLGLYTHFNIFPGDHIAVFMIDRWRQDRVPAANSEIAEQQWASIDALPEGIAPGAKRRLDELFAGRPRDTKW